MADSFKPPKQWQLTENETITSFANWQSNIMYHLSLNNDFGQFLDSNWGKKSTANRGLEAVGDKTPLQRNIILERMLALIAQFVPSLLRNDIIKKSTSLTWIWQRIRKHYSFAQSEVNFLKLSTIKRESDERYETFFQRIIAHLEDNLLTVESGLLHDGALPTSDEEMSPTLERLAVYMWLTLIDERLPAHVARVYAHDLQSKTIKEIQPQLAEAMDCLLSDLSVQDEIAINYTNSRRPRQRGGQPQQYREQRPFAPKASTNNKSCILCKSAGRNHQGHDIASCYFLSKFEKMKIANALSVDVSEELVQDPEPPTSDQCQIIHETSVQKVQCDSSPYFHAFYQHHPAHVVIDTGATSSLISRSFIKRAGITIQPTRHSARSVDKTTLKIHGEVKLQLNFGTTPLPVTALVVDTIDCDILAGVPFCKENDIQVHLKNEMITIGSSKFAYGSRPPKPSDIFRAESFILRSDNSHVILPGEYLEFSSEPLKSYEGEISIEPHRSSPLNGSWPEPVISRVIDGSIRIPNNSGEAVSLSKSQHFAMIRRVITPSDLPALDGQSNQTDLPSMHPKPVSCFSDPIQLDPDNQLSHTQRQSFQSLHQNFDTVFNPEFGAYNDYSGTIRAKVNLGNVHPPPQKGRLPFYKQSNLQILQEEADKLERLGVLAKPEDVNVDVEYVSPSFLTEKPSGGYRLVTAFNNLGQYTKILPTVSNTCNDVLRKLSKWKYLIKADLTKSFFQIPVAKSSMKYLGTVTPFKGLRVYTRSAMGMPGSSEHLQELMCRIFGDLMQHGFVIIIADDIHVVGNTIQELLGNWEMVLTRLSLNNLCLSAAKTVICPIETTILGWKWKNGTLSPCVHKTSPLASVKPPATCTAMRSFIGAFKALARCIPRYSSLVAPLEDCIKGMQGQQKINWTEDLTIQFARCQQAINSPTTITIPRPDDKLILTVDASPVNQGLGATLFINRDGQRHVSGFFSFKLKSHQIGWLPCEHEALAISSAVHHFAPYIRDSHHSTQVLTDNEPCRDAHRKLCQGKFSTSSRISTFLSTLSEFNVEVCHISGSSNVSSDFDSRNPISCNDKSCQICKFVQETADSVVQQVSIDDILSGSARMPFLNNTAWHAAQQDCPSLRRTFAHLQQGTRPPRKTRHITDVRKYLRIATISDNNLLVVVKNDPYVHQRKLIIVPDFILTGLVTALHIQLNHPTRTQLQKVFDRHFYGIDSASVIDTVTSNCHTCLSLKKLPNEVFEQTSSSLPSHPGKLFSSDVLRRTKQKILVSRDIFSSYTTAVFIPDEKAETLRSAVLTTTSHLRAPSTVIRVDSAPGFQSLKSDKTLASHGIALDYGRVKNKNSNATIDKGIQELENELIRIEHEGKALTPLALEEALSRLNARIRSRGLSSKEIIHRRDQSSGKEINVKDDMLLQHHEQLRKQNHEPSALSKGRGGTIANNADVQLGDLVFVKHEGSKHKTREQYIVTNITGDNATVQKFDNAKFMTRRYELPLTRIYPATFPPRTYFRDWDNHVNDFSSSDEDTPDPINANEAEPDEARNDRARRNIRRPRYLEDYVVNIQG